MKINLKSTNQSINVIMNEFDLIREYFTWPINDPNVTLGVGDDAALFNLEQGYQLVTTTDTLTEGAFILVQALQQETLLINL